MPTTIRVRYPSISYIAARSDPGNVIGCDNRLPWHLKSDLRRFRELTTGHAVIMGRRTFESIGRILPNRTNIVLSRELTSNSDESILSQKDENLLFASNRDAALFAADLFSIVNEKNDIFVIGGQNIYEAFSEQFNRIHLTLVFAEVQGDAYFNMKFSKDKWKMEFEEDLSASDSDQYNSRYIVHHRRKRYHRYRYLRSFYTEQFAKQEWVCEMLKKHERKIQEYENRNSEHQEEFDFNGG